MDGPEVRTPALRSPVSSSAHNGSSALSLPLPLFVFQGRFRALCKVCSLCEMAMLAFHCLPLQVVVVLLQQLHFFPCRVEDSGSWAQVDLAFR